MNIYMNDCMHTGIYTVTPKLYYCNCCCGVIHCVFFYFVIFLLFMESFLGFDLVNKMFSSTKAVCYVLNVIVVFDIVACST